MVDEPMVVLDEFLISVLARFLPILKNLRSHFVPSLCYGREIAGPYLSAACAIRCVVLELHHGGGAVR